MKRLLKLQLMNIFKQKYFYICLLIFLLLGPVLSFAASFHTSDYSQYQVAPQLVEMLTSEVGAVSLILIIIFTCLDFNEGTTKNIIGRGYTKTQLLISKIICSFIALLACYIITFILCLILFGANGLGFDSSMGYFFIHTIVKVIALTILYVTVSFLLEKTSYSILACLFVPQIIVLALTLVDSKLHLETSKYWITNISSQFINDMSLSNLNFSLVAYIIYIVLIVVGARFILKNKEVK